MITVQSFKLSNKGVLLYLLAGPFFLWMALGLARGAVSSALTASSAESWTEVQATVDTVELRSSRSGKSTTYNVAVNYHYPWQGRQMQGSRISFRLAVAGPKVDYEPLFRRLDAARTESRTVPCWVNPDDPSQAVLDRDVSSSGLMIPVIFALMFGLAGGVMTALAVQALRQRQTEAQRDPVRPWTWRDDWRRGELPDAGQKSAGILWGTAVVWNAAIWTFVSLIWNLNVPPVGIAFFGVFVVAGVVFVVLAVYHTIRRIKFPGTVFSLGRVPVTPGSNLEGHILVKGALQTVEVRLRLRCIRKQVQGSGKNRHTVEGLVWEDSCSVYAEDMESSHDGCTIPVRMAIPADAVPSSPEESESCILWRLEATADVAGPDFAATFVLPVFQEAA